MTSDDQSWMAFLDARFSVLALPCRRGGRRVQYLDVVTGWRGTSLSGERADHPATQRSAQLPYLVEPEHIKEGAEIA